MYKKIDFTKPNGLPLAQDILDWLQDNTEQTIQAVAKAYDEQSGAATLTALASMIIAGDINGPVGTQGFLTFNGEILPFQVLDPLGSTIFIDEDTQNIMYADNSSKPSVIRHRAFRDSSTTGHSSVQINVANYSY